MTATLKPKLAVLWRNAGPYHYARCTALSKHFEVVLIELVGSTTTHLWNLDACKEPFQKRTLFASDEELGNRWRVLSRIWASLSLAKPSILLIPSYSPYWSPWILLHGVVHRMKCILMTETNEFDKPRRCLAEFVKRVLLAFCDGAVVGGTSAHAYLKKLGFPKNRIVDGYDCVDVSFFIEQAKSVRSDCNTLRGKLGLPIKYYVVAARLVPEKNHASLLRAFARFQTTAEGREYSLLICGHGVCEPALRALAEELGIVNVKFMGFVQIADMAAIYSMARGLILPSTIEAWGLVVNEALACGTPVLVSKRAGVAHDLVIDGKNGRIFDPLCVDAIADAMWWLATLDEQAYARCCHSAMEAGTRYTPTGFADNIRGLIDTD